MTKIWDGINIIADDRVPEGCIGIDGPNGLELIRLNLETEAAEPCVGRYRRATEKVLDNILGTSEAHLRRLLNRLARTLWK